ncbi:DEAD/DEAH box helicase-domain-containing protein [Aspergillus affinis]|uniref:DEAD/DEAH box helicase-domain-containing protein n=1 Tax=Aspergillus affinis TaxID=1070780 RepID=UPI0022FEA8AC|nr:DEAD/DEAH box helicase-domain-containing protein [Aspergillus affinis]KAI9035721.1 DEAD/DEAH box helicase-domain-containing protein [Aspergillus affinis]
MEPAFQYLWYNSQYQCIICYDCQYALPNRLISRHLRICHQIESRTAIEHQLQCIPEDARPREDHTDFPPLADGTDAIPGLPIYDLLQCDYCGFLTASKKWLQRHHRIEHTVGSPRPLAWTPVQGQSWFTHARYCRYWVTAPTRPQRPMSPQSSVAPPNPDGKPTPPSPASVQSSPNGLCLPTLPPSSPTPAENDADVSSCQPKTPPPIRPIKSGPGEIPRTGMIPPRKEAITPWLAQTGWLRYLEGRPLQTLVELRGHPNTLQQDPTIASVWQTEKSSYYTTVLHMIGASFDRIMARALDTLDITHEPIRQIFHSTIAGKPYKRALDRLQPATEKRYIKIWKHFLYWSFRAAPFPGNRQLQDLGIPLDLCQKEHLHRIWTTLERFLCQPDAVEFTQAAPPPVITTASSEPPVTSYSPPARLRKRSLSVSSCDPVDAEERPVMKRQVTRYQTMIAVCIPVYRRPSVADHLVELSPDSHILPSSPQNQGAPQGRQQHRVEINDQFPATDHKESPEEAFLRCSASEVSSVSSDNKQDMEQDEDEEEEYLLPPTVESAQCFSHTDDTGRLAPPALPPAGQRWLDESLFSFCLSCLTTTSIQHTGDKFAANLMAFTAVLSIQASTLTLQEPYSYSSSLSALIWVSRVLLLEYALPLRRYHYLQDIRPRHEVRNQYQRAQAIQARYAVRGSLYPLHAILELLGRARWHIRHTARPGNILWSPDYQTLFYRGSPRGIHLDDIRGWIEALLQSVTQTLEHGLLLGVYPSIDLTTLVDDLGEHRAGFCFLDIPANQLQPTYAPLLAVQTTLPAGMAPLRQDNRWDPRAVMAYRTQAQWFLDHLALLIQLTWGQPSREPELLQLKWRNTSTTPRNLYLHQGNVLFITEYHKSQVRIQTTQHVARFLCPSVSRLVVLYLLRVRPFLVLLHQQLRKNGQPRLHYRQVQPSAMDDYLFALPGATPPRSQAGRITALMRETAQPFLHGQDITTCSYRHIAIAIAKKHLASQATPADWRIATAALSNILAAQAGHYSHINEQVYAVDVSQPFGLTPGRIEQFAVASRLWHTLVLRSVPLRGLSDCESHTPPEISPPYQPIQKPRVLSGRSTHAVQSLPWAFLQLYPEWQLLVCITCQTAIYPPQVRQHIEHHTSHALLSAADRQTIQSLAVQSPLDVWHRLLAQEPPIAPFPRLPQWEALPCQWPGCPALRLSRRALQTHIRAKHPSTDPSEFPSLIGTAVPAQSLTRAGGYIFRVQRAAGEVSADQGPPQQADHPGTRYPGCGVFVARPQEPTTALSQQ